MSLIQCLVYYKTVLLLAQSSQTLWPHGLCSPPCSSIHGFLQARTLERVAIPFSRGSSQLRDRTLVSHIAGVFFTIWATREAHEYWSGQPIPSPKEPPNPGKNWGLWPCRRILYQLSYMWNPRKITVTLKLVNTYWALTCSRQSYKHTHAHTLSFTWSWDFLFLSFNFFK